MAFGNPKVDSGAFIPQLSARLERLSDGNVVIHLSDNSRMPLFYCTKCKDIHKIPLDAFTDTNALLDEETLWANGHKHPTNIGQSDISLMQMGAISPVAEEPISVEPGARKLKAVV